MARLGRGFIAHRQTQHVQTSSGTNYPRTATDSVATISDAASVGKHLLRSGADSVAVSDSVYDTSSIAGSSTSKLWQQLTAQSAITVGENPHGLAVSPDQTKLWVVGYGDGSLTPITIATGAVGTPITVGANARDVAIAPNGVTALVTIYAGSGSSGVVPVNLSTGVVGSMVTFGTDCHGVTINPAGTKAVISAYDAVYVLDIASMTVSAAVTGSQANNCSSVISLDGTTAWVACIAGVYPVTIATLTAGTLISMADPQGIVMNSLGTKLYVPLYTTPGFARIDIASASVDYTVPLPAGSGPSYICLSPDNTRAFITTYGRYSVQTVDTAAGALGPEIFLGTNYAVQIAMVGDSTLYVTNGFGNTTTSVFPIALGPPQVSVISHTAASSTNGTSVTTPVISTTGASLLVATVSGGKSVTPTLSDSAGNTWVQGPRATSSLFVGVTMFYCSSPITSSSHTFTPSASGTWYPAISVIALANTQIGQTAEINEGVNGSGTTTSLALTNATPAQANEIVIAGLSTLYSGTTIAINENFWMVDYEPEVSSESYGVASALLMEGAASTVGPTWTIGSATYMAAGMMSFKASAQLAVTASDLISVGDAVARIGLAMRTVADSSLISDSATDQHAISQAANESFSITDVTSRNVSISKSIADSLTISDLATDQKVILRNGFDSTAISDTSANQHSLLRSVSDSSAITDATSRQTVRAVASADSSSIIDAVTQHHALLRVAADGVSFTDSVGRTQTISRSSTDSVGSISDFGTGIKVNLRTGSDSFSISDTNSIRKAFLRPATDSLAISDLAARLDAITRSSVDSIAISDALQRIVQFIRTTQPTNTYRAMILGDTPVSYWRFDDTTSTLVDTMGTNNATWSGNYTQSQASLISTDVDASTSVTSAAAVLGSTPPVAGSAFSLEIWFKTTSTTSSSIFDLRTGTTADNLANLYWNTGGQPIAYYGNASGSSYAAAGGTFADGNRHHLVSTYDGGTIRIYIDGALSGTAYLLGPITTWGTSPVAQWGNDALNRHWVGTLDEGALYTHVLTPAQIRNHYLAGLELPDIVSVSDQVSSYAGRTRTSLDSVSLNDLVSARVGLLRASYDTTILSDSPSISRSLIKSSADSFTLSDISSQRHALVRGTTDLTSISDSAVDHRALLRALNDTFSISDLSTRSHGLSRPTSDAFSIADILAVYGGRTRGTSDSTSISDLANRLYACSRAINDVFSISDQNSIRRALYRPVYDSLSVSDLIQIHEALGATASDVVAVIDAVTYIVKIALPVYGSGEAKLWVPILVRVTLDPSLPIPTYMTLDGSSTVTVVDPSIAKATLANG